MHHRKRYGKSDLTALLKKNGFLVEFCSYWNFFLFLPMALLRLLRKKSGRNESDVESIPSWLNTIFYGLLKIENSLLLQRIPLPWDLSLVCIVRKTKEIETD